MTNLPYSCIAFDSRIHADIELPGAAFRPERPPSLELKVRKHALGDLVATLDRRMVSTGAVSREVR